MGVLVWFANYAPWVVLIGAVCAIAIKFEKLLPKRLHKFLIIISLFITFATALLGLLKKNLDDQWKTEIQRQVSAAEEATRPKPLKVRLISCLNSIDPIIMQAMVAGQTRSRGVLKTYQLAELQKLAAEQGATEYIKLTTESALVFMNDGTGTPVIIELKPAILK